MRLLDRFIITNVYYASEPPLSGQSPAEETPSVDVILKVGAVGTGSAQDTIPNQPLQVLAHEAAAGRRGAAWQLLYRIQKNDESAVAAIIDSLDDDRLARYLLEWMTLGTWAGKPFVVPASLRSPSARMHLYTVFRSREAAHPSRAERVLIEQLHGDRPALRRTAAKILGLLRSASAVPALIEALHDPVEAVQLQVVNALGCIKSPAAIPALINLLQPASEQLGNQIFTALAQIGPAAVPPLINMSKDNSPWLRWHSIHTLGKTNDLRALPVLVQALADTDHSIAWAAAKGLIPFGRRSVGPVLRLLMFNNVTPWLVETASSVLNHQGDPKLDPYIKPVLQQMHGPSFSIGTMLAAQKALADLVTDDLGEECGLVTV